MPLYEYRVLSAEQILGLLGETRPQGKVWVLEREHVARLLNGLWREEGWLLVEYGWSGCTLARELGEKGELAAGQVSDVRRVLREYGLDGGDLVEAVRGLCYYYRTNNGGPRPELSPLGR
jgi:hypothetical protein